MQDRTGIGNAPKCICREHLQSFKRTQATWPVAKGISYKVHKLRFGYVGQHTLSYTAAGVKAHQVAIESVACWQHLRDFVMGLLSNDSISQREHKKPFMGKKHCKEFNPSSMKLPAAWP